uniref:PDZ domain-containing protein n=1 Tax=Macrostomum lignano TaxID=282301 RepID=A0A1I8FDR5_9PLAT
PGAARKLLVLLFIKAWPSNTTEKSEECLYGNRGRGRGRHLLAGLLDLSHLGPSSKRRFPVAPDVYEPFDSTATIDEKTEGPNYGGPAPTPDAGPRRRGADAAATAAKEDDDSQRQGQRQGQRRQRSKYWEKVDVSEKSRRRRSCDPLGVDLISALPSATGDRGSAASHAVWFEKPVARQQPKLPDTDEAPAAKAKAENGEGLIRVVRGFETGSRKDNGAVPKTADTIRTVQDGGASADLLSDSATASATVKAASSTTDDDRDWHGGVVGVEVRYGGGGAGVQVDGNLDDWELRLVAEAAEPGLNEAGDETDGSSFAGLGQCPQQWADLQERILCSSGLNSGDPRHRLLNGARSAGDFAPKPATRSSVWRLGCPSSRHVRCLHLPCRQSDGDHRAQEAAAESAENPTAPDLRAIAARLLRPRLSDWLVAAGTWRVLRTCQSALMTAFDSPRRRLPGCCSGIRRSGNVKNFTDGGARCGVWDDWRRASAGWPGHCPMERGCWPGEAWTGQSACRRCRTWRESSCCAGCRCSWPRQRDCRAVVAEEMAAQVAVMAA